MTTSQHIPETPQNQHPRHGRFVSSLRARVPAQAKHTVLRVLNRPYDLQRLARRSCAESSARLVEADMPHARALFTPFGVLDHALAAAPQRGMVLEFGVYSGTTLRRIAAARPDAVGFDSFQGLPEDWRSSHPKGAFARPDLPDVGSARLQVGWFHDTLPGFLAENPGPAAFVHLDADLYSSTATVLQALTGRITAGTVLLFDEYFNYPEWQEHEHKAFTEFIAATGHTYRYVAYNRRGEQVAVQILR